YREQRDRGPCPQPAPEARPGRDRNRSWSRISLEAVAMTSLRARLFVILVATTGAIWLGAIAWTYLGTQRELERVLDTRLQEAARMVSSLVRGDEDTARAAIGTAIPNSAPGETVYERQLTCQIWSMEGRLVATSAAAPAERMTESRSGFSD